MIPAAGSLQNEPARAGQYQLAPDMCFFCKTRAAEISPHSFLAGKKWHKFQVILTDDDSTNHLY